MSTIHRSEACQTGAESITITIVHVHLDYTTQLVAPATVTCLWC